EDHRRQQLRHASPSCRRASSGVDGHDPRSVGGRSQRQRAWRIQADATARSLHVVMCGVCRDFAALGSGREAHKRKRRNPGRCDRGVERERPQRRRNRGRHPA
ncbi:unnamed protein product, partial [Ectocarpus sp. 12 AP-2014]